jgi:hypothetical protein
MTTERDKQIIAETRQWVQDIVIRHNLCPFAHKPFRNDVIRYSLSHASSDDALVNDLINELLLLRDADVSQAETTLLITPHCLNDFSRYNQFLDVADMLISQFGLEGTIQVASFHPDYQFADLDYDDVRNYTNRSLYPMFHLILEASIERARISHPDVESIPKINMTLLQQIGLEEIKRQQQACKKQETEHE